MNLAILVLLGLVIVLISALVFYGKKKAYMVGFGIFFLFLIFSIAGFQYAFNSHFRIFIDLNLNPARQHMLYTGNESPLPLPPRTAFAFRGASNSCTYYTEMQKEEIIAHFRKLGNDISLNEEPEAISTQFMYLGYRYRVTIRPAESGKGSYLWAENL